MQTQLQRAASGKKNESEKVSCFWLKYFAREIKCHGENVKDF